MMDARRPLIITKERTDFDMLAQLFPQDDTLSNTALENLQGGVGAHKTIFYFIHHFFRI
jgi:hypothetical protein